MMLNKSGESGHPYLVPHLRGNTFSLSPLSMMLSLILHTLLCLGSPFHRLQVRSSRCFWYLSPVAKVGSVGCIGFLVEGTSA